LRGSLMDALLMISLTGTKTRGEGQIIEEDQCVSTLVLIQGE
jgi:hypothetical protein